MYRRREFPGAQCASKLLREDGTGSKDARQPGRFNLHQPTLFRLDFRSHAQITSAASARAAAGSATRSRGHHRLAKVERVLAMPAVARRYLVLRFARLPD